MSDPQSKAQSLLKEGNNALSDKNLSFAIEKFGEACQLLDQLHGDLAPENGDAYFTYGKALLEYAIQQNTVLGQSAQADATAVEEQQKKIKEVEVESSNPLIQMESIPEFKDEEEVEEEEEEEEEEEDKEGDDDFETAWDILDAARLIFEKSDDKETQLKLADVHLCLADVSLETEKFDDSLVDYENAITIKEKHLDSNDRELAEAYYKIALALEFSLEKSDKAVPYMQKAIDVLKKNQESLEQLKEAEMTEKVKMEFKDIKELIPEMELKIEELSSRQTAEKEAATMLKNMLGLPKSDGSAEKKVLDNTSVNDLSTLVKRKSKQTTESKVEKKPKLE